MRVSWRRWAAFGAAVGAACSGPPPAPATHAPLTTWPWPGARPEALGKGTTRWESRAQDGTELQLIEFDFGTNPRLRFELYDQDEDDAVPFDNQTDYYPRGVGGVTKSLNETRKVVAAWNGLFFAYDRSQGGPNGVATHIGPNVIRGRVRYNVGNHRWAFGVKGNRPKALHLPDKATLAREFDYASVGAQCLVREGKPLRVQPFPAPGAPPVPQPVPSTPDEAGHIPLVDHMKTSRTSMGWSRDGSKLWLLVVVESDHELGSKLALKRGEPDAGGWTLADLQRFWLAFGAWGAVNSDGGAVTQLVLLRPDGKYEMQPPRISSPNRRLVFGRDFKNAPEGGTLMTFYVREGP